MIRRILKNKRGEATFIYLPILIIAFAMILSILILYMGLCSQIELQKRDIKRRINGYLSQVAIEEYDSIKQGDSFEDFIDYDALEKGVYTALGFAPETDFYTDPNHNCTMIRPIVTTLRGDGFGVKVEYEAIFPIIWNGKVYTSLTIPVCVTGYYKNK